MKNNLNFIKCTQIRSLVYAAMTFAGITANAQTINTIAGTGTMGYSGDGGSALSATLHNPHGLAIDPSGNIFVADNANNTVRKIAPSGVITTVAGTGTAGYSGDGTAATTAALNAPFTVALDGSGNLYIGDAYNHRVRKVNPAGIITTVAGTGISGFSGDGGQATAARLNTPCGLATDAAGNLYIADTDNGRIRKVSPSGIISTVAGNGVASYGGDGGPATDASLWIPNYIHLDAAGNLYIADNQNKRIRKVTTSGMISTFAGTSIGGSLGDGGPATNAQLNYPAGITDDGAGNIMIADYSNSKIRKVSASGIITTYAGTGGLGFSGDGGPAIAATFYNAVDVAYDNYGRLVVADMFNNRVRRIGGAINHAPFFTAGHSQSLDVCVNEATTMVPIGPLLAIRDTDAAQTETWSVVSAPAHGTLLAAFTSTSTGSVIIPSGLSYSPVSGYTGTDIFKVSISDGIDSDTTTINVTINFYPDAGVISGTDSVCPGDTVRLSETVTGGIWSSSNPIITAVNSHGTVAGLYPGTDTIIYTVYNSCGVTSVLYPFYVRSYTACHTGIAPYRNTNESDGITIFPNPGKGRFIIQTRTSTPQTINYLVTNALGQRVSTFTAQSNQPQEFDLKELPTGIYYVTGISSESYFVAKLVVEN